MKTKSYNKAFTLIEVVVATAILILVIGGIVAVEVQSIKISAEAKSRLNAMGWSQEGLNVVQKQKDKNLMDSPSLNPMTANLAPGAYYLKNDDTWASLSCPGIPADDPTCLVTDPAGKITSNNRDFTQKIIIRKVE